jgi:hypothetical protein
MTRAGLLAAIGILSCAASTWAQPANDSYAGRRVLLAANLPFAEVVDTTGATTDAADADINSSCGAPSTDASVWYELVGASDGLVHVDVSSSDYSAGVIVATGVPGAFSVVTCGPGAVDFSAHAGESYTVLAFDDQQDGGGNGGALTIGISQDTAAVDLLARLRALPGVVAATLGESGIPGTSFFDLLFEQPLDHKNPGGPAFLQRVTVLHRGEDAPTVLALDGYDSPPFATQTELTYLLQANQIRVEHRFFGTSRPQPLAWEYLNIAQAAADDHRIVESFKQLYAGTWISTGASKGGMTAVYHRYFYPDDVGGSLAYVAPSSHGTRDARYVDFVAGLGSTTCRDRLRAFQEMALSRREEIGAVAPPDGFDVLRMDRALEFAIVELPFSFWQYSRFNTCGAIPGPEAGAEEMLAFLNAAGQLWGLSDAVLEAYAPYYYQAATELGGPRFDERALQVLLRYPREDAPAAYPPLDVEKDFDAPIMQQVEQWVYRAGRRLLFVYGGADPWSGGAFSVRAANDSYRVVVEGGDHLSTIRDLAPATREFVLRTLSDWIGDPTHQAVRRGATEPGQAITRPTRRELFIR